MRILFWVPYPKEGASNRYRVQQYLPYLGKYGIKYTLHSFWNKPAYRILYKKSHYLRKIFSFICGTISRIIDFLLISRFDIIFIHRESYPIGPAFFESAVALLKKPVIFDFDDAIFLPASSRQNNFVEIFKNPDKVARIIKLSSHVIAGNRYLSNFALRYNSSVTIIPTPIDTGSNFHDSGKNNGDKVIIGWMGSVTTLDFLNAMRNTFICLSERFPQVVFKIVGGDFSVDGLSNIASKPWSLDEEKEDLMAFDIGIMPMPDNEWTKGKCGFKAILYMNMGIPCVCSSVGMNKEVITDGVNGFLASTEEEWIKKLSLLIERPELRRKIGIAGRKTVEDKYSLKANAPKLLEVINNVYKRAQP